MPKLRVHNLAMSLDGYVAQGFAGIGATITGRNMFGPVREFAGSPSVAHVRFARVPK